MGFPLFRDWPSYADRPIFTLFSSKSQRRLVRGGQKPKITKRSLKYAIPRAEIGPFTTTPQLKSSSVWNDSEHRRGIEKTKTWLSATPLTAIFRVLVQQWSSPSSVNMAVLMLRGRCLHRRWLSKQISLDDSSLAINWASVFCVESAQSGAIH